MRKMDTRSTFICCRNTDFIGGPGGPTDAREGRTTADAVIAASAVRI